MEPVFFYWRNASIEYVYCGGRHAKIVIKQDTSCYEDVIVVRNIFLCLAAWIRGPAVNICEMGIGLAKL